MPDSPMISTPAKGRCLLWSRQPDRDRESRDMETAMDRGGWMVSVRTGQDGSPPSVPFDLILVEELSAFSSQAVAGMRHGETLVAAILSGPVAGDQLAPFDLLFCDQPSLIPLLRGLGKAIHRVPAGADWAERCLEILERHWRYRRETQPQVDWSRISYGHAEITPGQVTGGMTRAWQSEEIPARQRALVQTELREMYLGRTPKVYQALADALRPYAADGLSVLEIGCASGYYYEILEYLLNRRLEYEGADYSDALIRMARSLYPRTRFHVADGAKLPFPDGHFPVAISSCVLLHVPNWLDHIRETARVAGRVVIAHRTPVCRQGPTQYLKKFAYGVETVELLFNEEEILSAFRKQGLSQVAAIDLGGAPGKDEYCITYVFEKQGSPAAVAGIPAGTSPVAASEPPAAEGSGGIEDFLKQGEAAFSNGDLEGAKSLFTRAGRFEPDNSRLLNDLGVLACEEGEVVRGLDLLQRAYAKDRDNRNALVNLTHILIALERGEFSRPLLDLHLSKHPADSEIRALRDSLPAGQADGAAKPAPTAQDKPISVMWRNRADMVAAKGGDGIVIEETIRALEGVGHKPALHLEAFPDLRGFDIVHLNNISRSQDTLEHLRHAKSFGKPTVLTSLYEDMDRYLRPAMKTDLLFRYLATKGQVVPLEALPRLRDAFELEADPLDDPMARRLGIGDSEKQRAILQGVDLILTSGKGESDSIRRKFGSTAPIAEMHYGFNRSFRDADARLFTERHGLKDFALCVGRLEPRKNQWQLIEVFRALPHLKLVLVGVFSDPSMEPLIKSYAPSNVVFLPRLPLEELASAFAAARLHVLPSWYELPGLVSLEAAAAGCRVATTDWGTARDYFGELAHYLPPDDPVAMRKAILEAFDSSPRPGLKEHVLDGFSWEKTAAAAAAAYRKVLSSR